MNYNINKSNNQVVAKGYKQTKVGVIPEDWEVVKLGSVCDKNAKYGINAPAVEFNKNLPLYLRITDIDEKGKFNPNKIVSVKDDEYKRFILQENELVLARTGATVGKSYLYNKKDGELVYAGFLIKISPNIKKLNSVFLKNYLYTSFYWYWVKIMSVRSGQPGINAEEYSLLPIALPPLKEQEKIAEILTTWDNAISKQEELIKAKEELKKGLMQKLLSGEVRFNEFFGEWKNIKLGNICKITTGKLNANAMVENGKYAYFTCARNIYKIDKYDFDTEALLISGNGANVGYIHYYKGKFNAYQRTYVLDSFENNIIFIKYILDKYLAMQISREKNDGNTPYITLPTLTTMKLKLPSLHEQQKIAEVLINADKEIDLLKNELEELKKQKKGLMQKLLTGEVRVKV